MRRFSLGVVIVMASLLVSSMAQAAFTTTAGSATAATPVSGQPASAVVPGQTITFSVTIKSTTAASNVIIDLELYNSVNQRVDLKYFTAQSFTAGQSRTYTWTYVVPAAFAYANYTLQAAVFSANWASMLYWNSTAAAWSVVPGYPFAGQTLWVNPGGSETAATYMQSNPNACAPWYPNNPTLMSKISTRPAAVWLGDWIDNSYLTTYISNVLTQAGSKMVVFVAYNIPKRDCGSYSAGGTTEATYPAWITQVAQAIGTKKAAIILEPDALTMSVDTGCLTPTEATTRRGLIRDAILTIRTYAPNTAIYVDIGHSHWLSVADAVAQLQAVNIWNAAGFSLNVSNYFTTDEQKTYGNSISAQINNKHYVIDTSANGLGPSSLTDPMAWCNPLGRGLGYAPQSFSTGAVDAYLWVHTPGQSGGTCNAGWPESGIFMPQYACDQAFRANPP